MAQRIFYRLSDDPNNAHALWSGAITVPATLGKTEARRAVATHLNCKRLPARTLVVSDHELQLGQWTEDEIRAETTPQANAPTNHRKVNVSIHDVPLSMDDVQDMLKKFGLA